MTLTCFPCHRRVWENVWTVFNAVGLNICLFCLAHTLLHRSACKHRSFERLLELLKWWHSRPEITLLICITWNIFSTNGTDGTVCTYPVVLNVWCMLCQTWTEMLFFVRAINQIRDGLWNGLTEITCILSTFFSLFSSFFFSVSFFLFPQFFFRCYHSLLRL